MDRYNRNNEEFSWSLGDGRHTVEYRIDPVMVSNDPASLRVALLNGEGLMLAADVMVRREAEQGCVGRVLAGWTGPAFEVNAVFPRGRGKSPKVRAFVDFLVERLGVDVEYMTALCPNGQCHDATEAPSQQVEPAVEAA